MLFTAQFSRAGADLLLTGEDGKAFVVHDYFSADIRARLLSAEGAALSPDVVAALAGPLTPGQYAQAGAAQPAAQAVGRVVQASGDATIVRNGVAMAAQTGEAILKGDVLQTVTGTFGVTFNDGSTLNLTANSRLVVNEFVYDPKGSANSQLLDLVQGSLTFISGEVAHNGDMKIGTPVATMAIRGTVGGVTTANDGTVNFYVSQSATGAVVLDRSGTIIANVVQDGPLIIVRPVGPLQVLAEEVQKSPAQLATELSALQQIVSIQAVGQQIIQQFFQQDPNATPNPNPQSTDKVHTQIQIELQTSPTPLNDPSHTGDNAAPQQITATVTVITPPTVPGTPPTVEHDPIVVTIPANLAPINFGPLTATATAGQALTFTGQSAISVFDADTANLTVTLSAQHGVLTLSGTAGLTFAAGDGDSDATMTFSGTQADINAALDGMKFTPDAQYTGAANVTVTTSDGVGAPIEHTIDITINSVNDAPELTGTLTADISIGGSHTLTTAELNFADPDDIASGVIFSVSNLDHGSVYVDGSVSTSFTGQQLAGGQVSFLQDGSGGADAGFSVSVEDGNEDHSTPVADAFHFVVGPTRDFEAGLQGWSVVGAVNTTTAEHFDGASSANLASAVSQTVATSQIESFVGIDSGTLAGLNNNNNNETPVAGSAMKATFYLNGGDTFSFDWKFQTHDYLPYNDFAFFSVTSGGATELADVASLGNTNGHVSATGWHETSFTAQDSGQYTFGFGVIDVRDSNVQSNLFIDHVHIATGTA